MKQKITFLILSILLIGLFIFKYDKVIEEQKEDETETILSLTIDGEKAENFPSKESGKTIERIECEEGVNAFWDYETWGPVIKNVTKNKTKCQFHFVSRYHENILNGADPVLKEGLIPVTIENDGTVKKAYLGREWYDYETQKWANAVVLEDENQKYMEGEIIPESNIESYFVWIPKYRYKLWDLGNYTTLTSTNPNKVHDIEIIFGDYDTVDEKSGECKTPGVSGETGNCSVGHYMTHPAFQAFGTKGLWVGKFETGYKGATSTKEAEQDIENVDKVEIKPNVYSWREIKYSLAHLNSYNYKREYDSHLMKSTEWGAVAYLQHSIYGSRSNVRINNNSNYITGYSAVTEPTCSFSTINNCNENEGTELNVDGTYTKRYNSEVGYLASTTGNISGIYDMSGGTGEIMMSMILNSTNTTPVSGRNATYNSGFNGPFLEGGALTNGVNFPEKKYYDTYRYATAMTSYLHGILGDASRELGPFSRIQEDRQISSWYQDEAWLVTNIRSWITRGNDYEHGTSAGIFAITAYINTSKSNRLGYRIILAI